MEDLIKREDVLKAFYDNLETSEVGTALNDEAYLQALKNIPSIKKQDTEPNLILPECMERGECYEIGETIVVVMEEFVRKKDVETLLICSNLAENKTCGEVAKALQTLPIIKQKQGEWIPLTGMQPPELHGKHYCSNCDHILHLKLNGGVYNYCPNCGAKMNK